MPSDRRSCDPASATAATGCGRPYHALTTHPGRPIVGWSPRRPQPDDPLRPRHQAIPGRHRGRRRPRPGSRRPARSPCFVGPSGCGKTTSLRMINRMIEPTSGTIWLDDQDTATIATPELRRGIGYVIQHAGLFPHRTDPGQHRDGAAAARREQGEGAGTRHSSCWSGSGWTGRSPSAIPAQLSGGQQQRVGVARALAADPPVMLMDEPFSAVDPVVREQLQEEFLRLQKELGKTIVFVTHDIDEAIKLGDQVAVLRVGGQLAQLATPARAAEPAGRRLRRRFRRPGPGLPGARLQAGSTELVPSRGAGGPARRRSVAAAVDRALDGWMLVRHRRGRRAGRLAAGRSGASPGRSPTEMLHRGGTRAQPGRLATRRAGRLPVLAERARRDGRRRPAGWPAP